MGNLEGKVPFKGDWFTCQGTVVGIPFNPDRPPWYTAAPGGQKKVTLNESSGKWEENTAEGLKEHDTRDLRWVARFQFADHTGRCWGNCFGEMGDLLMGCSAQDVFNAIEANKSEDDPEQIVEARFSEWEADVCVKEDTYNDQMRMRYTFQRLRPLDFLKDTRRMLNVLAQDIQNA